MKKSTKKQPQAETALVYREFQLVLGKTVLLTGDYALQRGLARKYHFRFKDKEVRKRFRLPPGGCEFDYHYNGDFRLLTTLGELLAHAGGLQKSPLPLALCLSGKKIKLRRYKEQPENSRQNLAIEENGLKFLRVILSGERGGNSVFISAEELGKLTLETRDNSNRWICLGTLKDLDTLLRFFRAFRRTKCFKVLKAKPTGFSSNPEILLPFFQVGSMRTFEND